MKNKFVYVVLSAFLFASCGGENKGTKFAPKEKESVLNEDEREERIAEKRASLVEVDLDSLVSSHGVKFSVLPPVVTDNLPQAASDKLGSKMIEIAARNGVSGLCVNPVLAMVSRVDCVDRSMTATAPQKAIVKYEVTTYCGNTITNDIYASSVQTITGVGRTFADAASKAMNELKDTKEIQQMLSTASERAIQWYSSVSNVQQFVDQSVAEQNYALAMALLSSVPEQATNTYTYAVKRNKEVSDLFFEEKSAELLGELEGAIAAAGDEYDPGLGAYLQVIPARSSSYARAKEIYDLYVNRVRQVQDDNRAKEHALEMERLQVEKIKAPYEAQATIARINADASVETARINADARVGVAQANAEKAKNANTGGFLGLGKLWDGTFNFANRLIDGIQKNDN